MKLFGRIVSKGKAKGKALVSKDPISFYGSIDLKTGKVIEKGHSLEGKSIKGKILIFPTGKGSTVGSYALYRLAKTGLAPKAIINIETEPIIATGAIISGIPLLDHLEKDISFIKDGMEISVNAEEGYVEGPF